MATIRSFQRYKPEIDWKKVDHIRPKLTGNSISLEVKPTEKDLPRVTVITDVNDPVLFAFCIYSWNSVLYPRELLNWVIIDSKNVLTDDSFGISAGDGRITRITKTYKNW